MADNRRAVVTAIHRLTDGVQMAAHDVSDEKKFGVC